MYITLTSQQLEQLLKLLPQTGNDTDEELNESFSGMVTCCLSSANYSSMTWIIDSGATDHMTAYLQNLVDVRQAPPHSVIKLPNNQKAEITHIGSLQLSNGLMLREVLYVPSFNHNLLSIHRLAHDNSCYVKFNPNDCQILRNIDNQVLGVGILENGLYCISDNKQVNQQSIMPNSAEQVGTSEQDYEVWHQRLGHVSRSTMQHIPHLKELAIKSRGEQKKLEN